MVYPSNQPDDPSELEGMENVKPAATLANITVFSDRFIEIDNELKQYDEYIAKLEEEQRDIEEVKLPTIMAELAMENFGMKDGFKLTVEPKFQGTVVLKDETKSAKQLEWLKKANGEDIIKFEVSCSFGKGKMAEAEELMKMLREFGFAFKAKRSVHAGTLASFVKEKMTSATEEVPLEELGWRYFNKATIKKKGFKIRKRKAKREEAASEDEAED
jgi:hypothetical protein